MSDPWEDVRKRVTLLKAELEQERSYSDTLEGNFRTLSRLLDERKAENEALLAVTRATEKRSEAQRHARPIPQDYWDEAVLYWEQEEGKALAALPPHLKGGSDEQAEVE